MRTQNLVMFPLRLGVSAARVSLKLTSGLLGTVARHRPGASDAPPPPQARPPRPKPSSDDRERAVERDGTPDRQRSAPSAASENGAVVDPRSQASEPPPPPPAPAPGPAADRVPAAAPDAQPDTPLTEATASASASAETLAEPDEVVAEFAEPGAEDGAGAQIEVEAPWDGYDAMAAQAVVDRIAESGPEQLAVVELYERFHKNRRTVLAAAESRLREANPPTGR